MLTGVTWKGPFPKTNFEVALEAMRVDGSDFFCGLTVPVGKGSCSLILGGWGGTLVGISCIDHSDASENETTQFIRFENGRWYKVRMRVTDKKIQAWLDAKKIIDLDREGKEFEVRIEVELSRPFGIAAYQIDRRAAQRDAPPRHRSAAQEAAAEAVTLAGGQT